MSENAEQKEFWNEVAGPKWVANQARLDRLMTPLTEALIQIAAPRRGERVLDVGCGCGELALRIADEVGPGGKVLGIDLSRPMLAHAAARSRDAALDARAPVAWLEADAMTHPFDPVCDLLVSRFGVMFFADKLRAFINLKRAATSGGRFAFLVWRGRDEVEWFRLPLTWIAPVLPTPEPTDGAVGPFGLAHEEETRLLLEEAGFGEVIAEPLDRRLSLGDSVEDAFALLIDTGPAAGLIREAPADQRSEAERLLREGLERLAKDDLEMRAACWVYRGKV